MTAKFKVRSRGIFVFRIVIIVQNMRPIDLRLIARAAFTRSTVISHQKVGNTLLKSCCGSELLSIPELGIIKHTQLGECKRACMCMCV